MIGNRLREERERLGLTQPVFAELAGAKKRTLIDWEKDVSSPTAVQLAQLAAAGADVLYILTGQRSRAQPAHDAAEQVLLDSYRRCSSQARQNLIQTAALLAAGLPGRAGGGGEQVNTASGAVQILGSKNRVSNKRT
ncbi:MAG TPA: helix-turn-helix domain-containing protein [Acidovorax sp.]|jgi:transcriptional regulator with XRE-family HTH domain|nr:helix-turn-helix domain-containing protein [Acidovorax sp.]